MNLNQNIHFLYRPQDIGVSLGEHNIKDQEFNIVKVTDILNHPQYNAGTMKYDFSILTLEEKVSFRKEQIKTE